MKVIQQLAVWAGIGWLLCTGTHAETYKLVTLNYPPYEYQKGDQVDGIVVRVLRRAFAKLGHEIEIEVLPWKRALLMARTGAADGIFTVYKTQERLSFLDYSKTIVMPQVVSLWALTNVEVPYNGDLASLSDVSIGLVDGVSYGAAADEVIHSGLLKHLEYAPDSQHNIMKLLAGRTAVIMMNRYGAMYHLKKFRSLKDVRELQPVVSSVPSYIAFSKKRKLTALRDQLDTVLQSMLKGGEFETIYDSYFGQ
ncbi:substrate-binding periplasmic protein [Roseibium sp.]|uniref:substrate-binding periplasmic protein n=1 Tax=Roseibium sp. TaxID=1936156 RepID=UPI003B5226FF